MIVIEPTVSWVPDDVPESAIDIVPMVVIGLVGVNNIPAPGVHYLSITKNNSDAGLEFTLSSDDAIVFHIFDATNKVFTLGTKVAIAGTDANQSWGLSFVNTGVAAGGNTIIQITDTYSLQK